MCDDIIQFILKYFRQKGFEIGKDTGLFKDEVIDSMELIELISCLEREYQVEFMPHMYNKESFATPVEIAKNISLLRNKIAS